MPTFWWSSLIQGCAERRSFLKNEKMPFRTFLIFVEFNLGTNPQTLDFQYMLLFKNQNRRQL